MSDTNHDCVTLPSGRLMSRRRFIQLFGVSAAAAYIAACAPSAGPSRPGQMTSVSMRLDWLIGGQHAPFYVAREKGYYNDANLDVDILEAKGSGEVVKLVGAKNATFGNADGGALVKGVAAGVPVKEVCGIVRRTSQGLAFLKESGINVPKDLEGKIYGQQIGSGTAAVWPAFAAANGIDVSKVQIVTTDPSNEDALMFAGRIHFVGANAGAEEARYTAQGKEGGFFGFADYGVNSVGHGIITNVDTIANQPGVVRGFVQATVKGWEDTVEDPQASVNLLLDSAPDMLPERRDEATQALDGVLPRLESPNTAGKKIGWMSEEDWQITIDILADAGELESSITTEDVYTNEFVTAV